MTGDSTEPDPHGEYTRRCQAAEAEAAHWGARERWLSHTRLVVFLATCGIGWLAFGTRDVSGIWIAPPIVLFIALLVVHDRAIGRHRLADRTARFFQDGLARLEDRWMGLGNRGDAYLEPSHPYAVDLDLFGEGSLFERVCTTRTPAGERILASWLGSQGEASVVRERQAAVEDLRERLDLRAEIALLGEDMSPRLNPEVLVEWGKAPPADLAGPIRVLAALCTGLSVSCLGLWIFTGAGVIPFVIAIALQSVFAQATRSRVHPVLSSVITPTRDLTLLTGLLERFETEPFEAPRLVELRRILDTEGVPPSKQIARLQRIVDLVDARGNQFFAPFAALLLWGTHLSFAIEAWRTRCGSSLGPWLESAGELEALCSLAGYAYENPADPFPEIVEEGAIFEGRGLGHPLLPRDACVRNDLSLGAEPQAYIMSGSNMSGKSTMLRCVGCNAVLALAGAPVRAEALRIAPLAIAASIQVADSLQTGTSHFYAEIKRLRQVVDLIEGELPVLFLLDEILHGTNSHDRRIGATAVVKGLIERGAMGIVTTHDLALAEIAEELAPRMKNVHFQDHLEDGVMAFDYRLQDGVVTKSNAIALMRSVGLEV